MLTGEDTPLATLLLSVRDAFAEFARARADERPRDVFARAKRRRAYRWRKQALYPVQVTQLGQRAEADEAGKQEGEPELGDA